MDNAGDIRELYSRQFGRDEDSERAPIYVSEGSRVVLCNTTSDGSYPTAANRVYKLLPVDASVNLTEGATPSYASSSDPAIYAVNLGSNIPANGTGPYAVRKHEDGNWYFRA